MAIKRKKRRRRGFCTQSRHREIPSHCAILSSNAEDKIENSRKTVSEKLQMLLSMLKLSLSSCPSPLPLCVPNVQWKTGLGSGTTSRSQPADAIVPAPTFPRSTSLRFPDPLPCLMALRSTTVPIGSDLSLEPEMACVAGPGTRVVRIATPPQELCRQKVIPN